jgi:hypothetical protein
VDSFGPLESAWSFHNKIILSIVNHYLGLSSEQFLNKMDIRLHKIFIHELVDLTFLCVESDIMSESVQVLNIVVAKVFVDDEVGVRFVFGDVVDVDSACHFDDQVQGFVEGVV